MNFQTILEELDRLYEEDAVNVTDEKVDEDSAAEKEVPLTEAAEDAGEEEIEIEDDSADDTEDAQVAPEEPVVEELPLVLECTNCGAVSVMAEADTVVDEESALVNTEDPCQYCEEAKGYRIIGKLAPYSVDDSADAEVEEADVAAEEDDSVEESLLDLDMPIDVSVQANGNDVAVGGLA